MPSAARSNRIEDLDAAIFPGNVPSKVAAGDEHGSVTPLRHDDLPWDRHPLRKMIGGKPVELFQVGALAQAMGVSTKAIYKWERLKIFPPSRYRGIAPVKTPIPGKRPAGRRLYTRAQIEVVIAAAAETNVKPRPPKTKPDWKQFTALVVRGWKALG